MSLSRHTLTRALDRPPSELVGSSGHAAVAAVLAPSRGSLDDLDLLLIKRAEHRGDPWSGHLAFPGGRVEPSDTGPFAAAIRETEEEVGLALKRGALMGQLDDLAAIGGRPGLVIRPYVFLLEAPLGALRPNPEVARIHQVPMSRLLANEGRTQMTYARRDQSFTLPCVDFDGERLWGLTLRMVDDLLDRIDQGGIGLDRIAERR